MANFNLVYKWRIPDFKVLLGLFVMIHFVWVSMIKKKTSLIRISDIPVSDFDIFELSDLKLSGLFKSSFKGGVENRPI